MAQPLRASIPLFDYLAAEESATVRHEYVGGVVHALVGGSSRHNRITLNVARLLDDAVDGSPCQVCVNDMRLHVQAADSVYYPDVFVHCGSSLADATTLHQDATLIVEVSSESTVGIDRREKLVAYAKLPGFKAYWTVSQETQRVDVHERAPAGG